MGEICVETRLSIESGNYDGTWFYLADYSNLSEFFTDCASWFCEEDNPEYIYDAWENIPDCLIGREWICPNIFEIRDALQSLDDELVDAFVNWCKLYGWDIATDDPYKLIIDFQSSLMMHNNDMTDPEDHEPDAATEDLMTYAMVVQGYGAETLDNNYN